jgi:hypothetical protein
VGQQQQGAVVVEVAAGKAAAQSQVRSSLGTQAHPDVARHVPHMCHCTTVQWHEACGVKDGMRVQQQQLGNTWCSKSKPLDDAIQPIR